MKCLIVEDDMMSRVSLLKLCEKISNIEIVAICEDATCAIEKLQEEEIDLIFLDVELPGITGIDLIKELDNLPQIIFTTAKKQYAADAFEYKHLVVDYITKPVSLPRLMNAVNKAQNVYKIDQVENSEKDYLFIRSEGRVVRINYNDLEFIETVGDYVKFKTTTKQFLVHSSLKNINSKIQHPDIIKVHRSYLINLSKIVDIEDNSILIGKKIIPVSRAHKATLFKRINPL